SNALNNSAHSTNRPSAPVTPQGNPPIRSSTPVVPQQNVNPELSPGNALVEPAVDVQKQKPHLEEARAGDDKISATETVKDSGPAKSPTSPAGEPGKQPAPEPPINITVNPNLLPGILKEAADLLRRNQFYAVEKLLNDKLHDPTCAGIVDRLKKEKSDLAEIQSLRSRAMDALRARAGTVIALKKGTMTGKVK